MQNVIDSLTAGVAAQFPGRELHYNKAALCKILGGTFITYDFAFAPGYNNIFHNAHGLIRFMIASKDVSGRKDIDEVIPITIEVTLWDYHYTRQGIKFRKINAKNVHDGVSKLVKWFEKNAGAMAYTDFKG